MTCVLSLLFHDVYHAHPSESGFPGSAADRYKLSLREFDSQLNGLAAVRGDPPILLTEVPPQGRIPVPFAITVDDGGVSYFTMVAERLEARGWRGHCLVTTRHIGQQGFLDKRQIRALHERGHLIGSHSVSHPSRMNACPREQTVREWGDSRKHLADILGQDVTIGSVPNGRFSSAVAMAAQEAGLNLLWTSEPSITVRRIETCTVMGRFTIRRGSPPDLAGKLGVLDGTTMLRERALWNLKKVARTLLGPLYPRLAARETSP